MPNITKKAIDTRKRPASGQTFVWDDELLGFGIRMTPGAISFVAESRIKGVKRRMTIGRYPVMTVEEARTKAREYLAMMANGVDPTAQKKQDKFASITLAEVLEVYLATKQLRASTIDVYRRQIKHAFKDWLHRPVIEITKNMVEDKHRSMANGTCRGGTSGRAYANGCFTTLQALLNFAAEKYEIDGEPLISVNPVSRLTKTRAWYRVHPRTGVIPESKIGAWYRSVRSIENQNVAAYFLLLLFTGIRRREGTNLKWTDVDFEAKTLTIRRDQAKNHRDHVLPLSEFLLDLLLDKFKNRSGSPYVFPGRGNKGHLTDFRMWLHQVRRECGCNFMIHDLRRSFLSCAERLKALLQPRPEANRLSSHSSSLLLTTPVYSPHSSKTLILSSIDRLKS